MGIVCPPSGGGENVEPENSEDHVNNDDKASTLHQTKGVIQAVMVQAGGLGQVEREVVEGRGGVGGGVEEGGSGERVVVQGRHDGRN